METFLKESFQTFKEFYLYLKKALPFTYDSAIYLNDYIILFLNTGRISKRNHGLRIFLSPLSRGKEA